MKKFIVILFITAIALLAFLFWQKTSNFTTQKAIEEQANEEQVNEEIQYKIINGGKMIKIPGKDYYMGETEVTIGQYLNFCKAVGKHYPQWLEEGSEYNIYSGTFDFYKDVGMSESNTNHPITGVSWYDAIAYAEWIGCRLPSEDEWEHSANGGEHYEYSGSNNLGNVGWYLDNSGNKTHPVKQKYPNGYGLYDMSGNVWEWTSTVSGRGRVLIGGGWGHNAERSRLVERISILPSQGDLSYGFRVLFP